jgi:hypothetical protein
MGSNTNNNIETANFSAYLSCNILNQVQKLLSSKTKGMNSRKPIDALELFEYSCIFISQQSKIIHIAFYWTHIIHINEPCHIDEPSLPLSNLHSIDLGFCNTTNRKSLSGEILEWGVGSIAVHTKH